MSDGHGRREDLERIIGRTDLEQEVQRTEVFLRNPAALERLRRFIEAAVARFHIPPGIDADDVVSVVWAKAAMLDTAARIAEAGSDRAYLWTMVHNEVLEALRSLGRAERLGRPTDTDELAEFEASPAEESPDIALLLDRLREELSEPDRALLWSVVFGGLSYAAASRKYGIRAGTLGVRVWRLRQRAKSILGAHGVRTPDSSRTKRHKSRSAR